MSIKVEVANKEHEIIGSLTEKDFATWKRAMGGNVGILWKGGDAEGVIIDSVRLMKSTLGPGSHQGLLAVKVPLAQNFGQADVEAWQLA